MLCSSHKLSCLIILACLSANPACCLFARLWLPDHASLSKVRGVPISRGAYRGDSNLAIFDWYRHFRRQDRGQETPDFVFGYIGGILCVVDVGPG